MNNDNDRSYPYSTSDLGCASALLAAGYAVKSIDKTNPKRAQFVFKPKTGIDKSANSYWENKLRIKAKAMFDSIKYLKSRIYNQCG